MPPDGHIIHENHEDVVDTLLQLPAKNLEQRVAKLEADIGSRQRISDEALSLLGTHRLRLREQQWRLRYCTPVDQAFRVREQLTRELVNVDELMRRERTDCFQSLVQLKEELQQAQEDFEFERQKLKLL